MAWSMAAVRHGAGEEAEILHSDPQAESDRLGMALDFEN